jgi:hypothetical protein
MIAWRSFPLEVNYQRIVVRVNEAVSNFVKYELVLHGFS